MKKMMLALFFSFGLLYAGAQQNTPVSIIPEPVSLQVNKGNFTLPSLLVISADKSDSDVTRIAFSLSDKLLTAAGIKTAFVDPGTAASIELVINDVVDISLGNEGYKLTVSPQEGVKISANKPAGLFYGVQTFYQLLPPAIESKTWVKGTSWTVPAVSIKDYPRFGWRGLMFDVVRHYFTKEEVKQFIDQMVKYKYNLLHLTLSNDEGWRIEIKSLPKLTEVGAWRVNKVGTFGRFEKPSPDEPKDYGGFYTQDDIKELVQYAKDRFVNILPEIDVPGHSLAAIASYPELSCTPGADKYQVRSGEKIMEWPPSGHFYGLIDNTLCPANEKVYDFLDKVFTEVAALFPFEYIHMGGDETARNFWEKTPEIKQLMKRENLKNLDEVQSYFVKRVVKIIESKGKKTIGWDEILQGGLAPNAAVMSWRGVKGGIEAAKQKHEVVMSPTTHAYLDYMQGDKIMEPPVYASLRLKKVYEFDPLPEGADKKYIKGAQGNLWTEQIYNIRQAEYMVWPRGFALAEDIWSPADKKNWKDFIRRVESQFDRFGYSQTKYAPSMYEPDFNFTSNKKGEIQVSMTTEVEDVKIYYSFDNSYPDPFYPEYKGPVTVPSESSVMRVVTYRGDKQVGRFISFPMEEIKKRAGVK